MNDEILKHLADTFAAFNSRRPSGYREALNFCSDLMDICVNSLHELAQREYEAYGTDGWKPSASKFAAFVGLNPEEIFGVPEDIDIVQSRFDDFESPVNADAETFSFVNQALTDLLREENGRTLIDVIVSRIVKEEPLQKIGNRYGVSRERIRQQEARALRTMKSNLEVRLAAAA